MKYYLSGPMTGRPFSNFPLFNAAAKWLRGQGFEVVSPAELDDQETHNRVFADLATAQSWADFLARDVEIIADECGGIILLPYWEDSNGARLEAFVGLLKHLEFKVLAVLENHDLPIDDPQRYDFKLYDGDRSAVRDSIHRSMGGDFPMPDILDTFRYWIDARWETGGWSKDPTKNLVVQALGLAGETGEVVEHFKKHIRDGAPLHTEALKLELGDVLHYWMCLVDAAGFDPQEVIAGNMVKLEARDAERAENEAATDAAFGVEAK